jgi:dethiobiotin synthetase
MAAEALGLRPPTIADLVAELQWPPDIDVGFVETAGGVGSPQAVDGDVVELVGALRPTVVVLVADAGLGTINAVRLSCRALQRADTPVIVHLNRFDPDEDLHRRNLAWLDTHDAHRAVTTIGDLAAALLRPPSGIR